ncbi:MAG: GNAT family N-acetyltransferase [Myxococcota bacterium]
MSLRVRRVESSEDLSAALALPARLHAEDPSWVAPIDWIRRRRTRAFLRSGSLALFVAERDGRVVGTISALRDKAFERDKAEKVAWFGYFETEDDPAVAEALFAAATDTARGWGATHLRGPRDLTRFEHVGLTVEGHDTVPPFLQGHHPRYVQPLVEAAGFVRHHDVLAYDISVRDPSGARRTIPPHVRAKADEVDIPGLEVRQAHRRSMGHDLRQAHAVLNTAFQTVPDVAPMPQAAFVSIGRPYLLVADTGLLRIATVNGEPVGFAACFPDINEAVGRANGSLLPLGWARVAAGLRHARTASFKLLGVVPQYRGTGLHARLIADVLEGVLAAGYERVEASVIDERNGPMRGVVEHIGMSVYRRYRFYERAVA